MIDDPQETAILTLGVGQAEGGALLVEGGRSPAVAELPAERIQRVDAELRRLLAPAGGLLIPGEDSDAVQLEREAGLRLAELLTAPEMRPVADRLGQLAGRAEARGRRLQLLIDARTPLSRGLPWELLEAIPEGAFVAAGCRVGRLCDGAGGRPRARSHRLEVVQWIPDPEDRVCARVATRLAESLDGLRRTALLDASDGAVPPPEPGAFRVVHVICHGRAQLSRVTMRLDEDRAASPDSVLRWLAPALESAGLVVLDVCGAASGEVDPLDAPAFRLVRGGAAACIAPRSPFDADASADFSRALYAALVDGLGLMDAVAEGRRALAGLALAHPSFRWWNPLLVVGDGATLTERPPVEAPSALAEWPRGQAPAEAALAQAEELARSQGFLGVEHIAHALARWDAPPPLLALFQPALAEIGRRLVLYGLSPQALPRLSPRLAELALKLPAGYDLEAVLRMILDVRWIQGHISPHLLAHLGDQHREVGRTTIRLDGAAIAARLAEEESDALTLEVEGGPEDGRRLELKVAGAVIGRWDPDHPGAIHAPLYVGPVATDRSASRRHVRYHGGVAIEALAPIALERRRRREVPAGERLDVQVDDRIHLGAVTCLRVVTVPHG